MLFVEFRQATGESTFDVLCVDGSECYRLSVEAARGVEHYVYRLQKLTNDEIWFVGHRFVHGSSGEEVGAITYRFEPGRPLWDALQTLLEVSRFWELPEKNEYLVLDGCECTLEAWKEGRKHVVERAAPDPFISRGELFSLVSYYFHTLYRLAMLECDDELRRRYCPDYVPVAKRRG
jgi:hypothetical protein